MQVIKKFPETVTEFQKVPVHRILHLKRKEADLFLQLHLPSFPFVELVDLVCCSKFRSFTKRDNCGLLSPVCVSYVFHVSQSPWLYVILMTLEHLVWNRTDLTLGILTTQTSSFHVSDYFWFFSYRRLCFFKWISVFGNKLTEMTL